MSAVKVVDRAIPVERRTPSFPVFVGSEIAYDGKGLIHKLTRYLAGQCDGAYMPDGHGFNKVDAAFGHKLAEMELEEWSDRQVYAAWKMLHRYSRTQLSQWWSAVPEIKEPPPSDPKMVERERSYAEYKRRTDPTWKPQPGFRRLLLTQIDGHDVIELQQSFDQRLIDAIKAMPQRKYDPKRKIWYAPLHLDTLQAVLDFALEWSYEIADDVLDACNTVLSQYTDKLELSHATDADIEIPGLVGDLFTFQKAGVAYASQVHDVLIADEMGLGKTVQALAAIQQGQNFPAIVICPASLKRNWERETRKWLPHLKVAVLGGYVHPSIKHWDGTSIFDVLIINYNSRILEKWLQKLIDLNPQAIIADECHALKNKSAQQTKLVAELIKNTDARRIFLSGTPVVNRPMEFFQIAKLLGYDKALGGQAEYQRRYDNNDQRALEELNSRARTMFLVRRLKKDVLKDLPDKIRTVVPLEIDNRMQYEEAAANIAGYFATKKSEDERFLEELRYNAQKVARETGMDVNEIIQHGVKERFNSAFEIARNNERLLRWEALKQVAVKGKMESVYAWIDEFMHDTDQKLVLFAMHTDVIESITKRFSDKYGALCIHGGVKVDDRMPIVDLFQNDPKHRLIIGNMIAMGEGLTLTAASNVAFIEFGWNPKTHSQAEDRCHRIGQKDTVNVYSLVAERTIDEEIVDLIEEKRMVVDAIQDGAGADTQRRFMDELQARLEAKKG